MLGIYVFDDKKGFVDGYVIDALSKISVLCSELCIVVKSEITDDSLQLLSEFSNNIIYTKEECNYLMGYRYGVLQFVKNKRWNEFDSILFFNNTFFGPVFETKKIFERKNKYYNNSDLWSIAEVAINPDEDELAYDFMAAFFVVEKNLLNSPNFLAYWDELPQLIEEENSSINLYFEEKGFKCDCIYDTASFDTVDNTKYNALLLLENGYPMVNCEVFTGEFKETLTHEIKSDAKEVIKYLREHTDYDINLIYDCMIRKCSPFNVSSVLAQTYILSDISSEMEVIDKNIAVMVFHMHYDILLDENISYLEKLPDNVDIIITTTSSEKVNIITEKVNKIESISKRTKVLLSSGNGRDMAGLLVEARPFIKNYKYIGFTHDKMSLHHNRTSGQSFARIILENIINSGNYVRNVINIFENNPRIGLLIPPPPEHGRYFAVIGRRWTGNLDYYKELCKKINIPFDIDSEDNAMSLGTAFWCRYDAMKELFEYPWEHNSFPDEPLPLDGSISHAIERAFPYIVKHNKYTTGVIYSEKMAEVMLNDREYLLTHYLVKMNKNVKMAGSTVESYISRTEGKFEEMYNYDSISYLKKKKKEVKMNTKLINKSRFFNKKWYLKKYPEVREFSGSPAEHYLSVGWRKGFDPSEYFSTEEYLKINGDVEIVGINPLLHYITKGYDEGRKYNIDHCDYRPMEFKRKIKRNFGRILYNGKIKKNKNAKILVILHMFYMSSWKEIKEYLKNLEVYDYDLLITYPETSYNEEVINNIKSYKSDVVFKVCDNLGYDVGPFLEALGDIKIDDYDIIYKLQSKGVNRKHIYIYGQYFKHRDWFLNLYEGCLGAMSVHKTIDKLMNKEKVGIVAAKNLIIKDPVHKQNMVKNYMKEEGMKIPSDYYFVSGTCFAAKAEIMKPIQDMGMTTASFQKASAVFSLAHKMERIICLNMLNDGYVFEGNKVMVLRRLILRFNKTARVFRKYSGLRLLDDKRFNIDDEFAYFYLEGRLIKKYEVIKLPLKEIKREWLGDFISLTECYPYRYLQSRDPKIYDEYCEINMKKYKTSVMSIERFEQLVESIDKKGFDSKNLVIVNEDNIIADGQHRCCYMMYKYGENYEMPVLRIYPYVEESKKDKIKDSLKAKSPRLFECLKKIYNKIKFTLRH